MKNFLRKIASLFRRRVKPEKPKRTIKIVADTNILLSEEDRELVELTKKGVVIVHIPRSLIERELPGMSEAYPWKEVVRKEIAELCRKSPKIEDGEWKEEFTRCLNKIYLNLRMGLYESEPEEICPGLRVWRKPRLMPSSVRIRPSFERTRREKWVLEKRLLPILGGLSDELRQIEGLNERMRKIRQKLERQPRQSQLFLTDIKKRMAANYQAMVTLKSQIREITAKLERIKTEYQHAKEKLEAARAYERLFWEQTLKEREEDLSKLEKYFTPRSGEQLAHEAWPIVINMRNQGKWISVGSTKTGLVKQMQLKGLEDQLGTTDLRVLASAYVLKRKSLQEERESQVILWTRDRRLKEATGEILVLWDKLSNQLKVVTREEAKSEVIRRLIQSEHIEEIRIRTITEAEELETL